MPPSQIPTPRSRRLIRSGESPARRVRGVVQNPGDIGFDLVVDDGSAEHIEYADIVQARTVFEWGPAPKPIGPAKRVAKERSG